jgi:hypothetical protein
MEVICLDEPAFYALLEKVVEHVRAQAGGGQPEQWVDPEAMSILKIKAKSTLQQLRDEGRIRFSQPHKRVILYDRLSLYEHLEKHAKSTF